MAADQLALRIDDVHTHYGASHVLHGVSLDVPARAVTAIVGRNGVGKTTLINSVMGLIPVTSGRVLVDDTNLLARPAHQRSRFGLALVPQGRRLFRSLSVAEHLNLVGRAKDGPDGVAWSLELFPQLREREQTLARDLSGGEQSMLAIARALVTNPSILLMDEPTEGLAPLLVQTVAGAVRSLRERGLTVLLVEQNLTFALAVADRIAVMDRGTITAIYGRDEIDDIAALSDLVLDRARLEP